MIKLNLNYSNLKEEKINKFQSKVSKIHQMIKNKTGEGSEMLDWYNISKDENLINDINNEVKRLKSDLGVEKLLTIGIGGSYLGAQAGINFINGSLNDESVIFAGINMAPSLIKQIEKKLENKKWAICVISKSGTTLEPALAFRHFKNLLEGKVGKNELSKYIIAVTDSEKGALKTLANENNYKTYSIPDGIGGRFSGITPVGLFPMAFAGVDINKLFNGVEKAIQHFSTDDLSKNIAYKYAISRNLISTKKNLPVEILVTYDQDLDFMNEWWKQLFGESEGKDGKGIYPSSVIYSRDLHSLGQFVQEGTKIFFETTIWINEEDEKVIVKEDENNLDQLNYLTGMSFYEINKKAFEGVVNAHSIDGKIPNIIIELENKSEESLGYLWYFFFVATAMSGYFIGVNPFNQPGVEIYKKNMFQNLKNSK